jgi:hypothetical protein
MSQYELYKKKLEKIFNQVAKIAFKGKDNKLEYTAYIDELIQKGDYGAFSQSMYYFLQIDIDMYVDVSEVKEKTWPEILYQLRTPFLKKLSDLYKKRKVYQSSFDIYSDDPSIVQLSLTGPLSATYSSTGATQSISFTKQTEKLFVNILDPTIFSVEFYRVKWVDNLPTEQEFFQTIRHGTYSTTYQTNVPLSFSSEYLVRTIERNSFAITNYKFVSVKNGLLGQIYERESQQLDPKYLYLNPGFSKAFGMVQYYLEVKKNGATSSVFINEQNPTLSDVQNQVNNYVKALDYLLS